jgi:alpha-beta hydrolase superfamily lysophospholipase
MTAMQEKTFTFETDDDTEITAYKWSPDGEREPKAIVEICHGMGEHAGRYKRLGEALTAAGYVVYAADQRGHGQTGVGSHGDFGAGGWSGLVDDIATLGALARKENPGLPLVVLGHSMGSFAVQTFLLDHSHEIDAAALSGTSAIDIVAAGIDPDAPVELSGFNAGIESPRTDYDWLSRDPDEVDKYIADEWCGFGVDAAGAKSMLGGGADLADPERLGAIKSELPIYLLSGDADPLAGGGALVHLVADRYRQAGVTDVSVDVYPGARHEVFNETNRDEVTAALVAWLDRVTA